MEDILREPTELIDQDLDAVAGGDTFNFDIDFNNADSNQGAQIGAVINSTLSFDF